VKNALGLSLRSPSHSSWNAWSTASSRYSLTTLHSISQREMLLSCYAWPLWKSSLSCSCLSPTGLTLHVVPKSSLYPADQQSSRNQPHSSNVDPVYNSLDNQARKPRRHRRRGGPIAMIVHAIQDLVDPQNHVHPDTQVPLKHYSYGDQTNADIAFMRPT
jgi:hypothetical protein